MVVFFLGGQPPRAPEQVQGPEAFVWTVLPAKKVERGRVFLHLEQYLEAIPDYDINITGVARSARLYDEQALRGVCSYHQSSTVITSM
jgi:hypothetical protein